jgi:AcrR family transcriptional regulator
MAQKAPVERPDRHETREAILKLASSLVQSRGFSAVSFGLIAEQLGLKAPAIHYHFPAKTDLGLALVERYRARYRRWMDEAADQRLPTPLVLEGHFRIASRFTEDGKACPVGVLTSEFDAIPPEMQPAVRAMSDEVNQWLAGVLAAGKQRGELRYLGQADDMAALISAALQGAVQQSRATGRPAFDAVLRQIRLLLGLPLRPN